MQLTRRGRLPFGLRGDVVGPLVGPEKGGTASQPSTVYVFTTAHPLDDVRVYEKLVRSLLAAGHPVVWLGPRRRAFSDDFRDPRVTYSLVDDGPGWWARWYRTISLTRQLLGVPSGAWILTPDPDAALAAAVVKRFRPTVFWLCDVHEAYHKGPLQRVVPSSILPVMSRLLKVVLRLVYARADLIAVVSRPLAEYYAKRDAAVQVVRNLAPRSFAAPRPRHVGGLRVFHGKLGSHNGTPVVLDALTRVAAEVRARLTVVMIVPVEGDPLAQMVRQGVAAGDLSSVELVAARPNSDMPELLARCDVGLVAYGRDLGLESLPNRLFEYMASSMAVVAPIYSPEIASVIREHDIGLVTDFEDPDAIAKVLTDLVADPESARARGARARAAFDHEYSWEKDFGRLLQAMTRVESSAVTRRGRRDPSRG